MRKLALGALLFGSLAMASGCIISSDDDVLGGYFTMDWILTAGSADISCANAGAGGVASLATLAGTQQGVEDIFTCGDGAGTTGLLPLGDYVVVVSVLEEGTDAELGTSLPRDASLDFDGDTVDIGSFNFSFGSAGDVDFSVDYGGAIGTNCDDVPTGEGVVGQRTTLTLDGAGSCISVELLVGGVSDLNDICAADALCVEIATVQTLVDVPPGDYVLTIEGVVDANIVCFVADEPFTVTDGDEDLLTIPVPLDTDACS